MFLAIMALSSCITVQMYLVLFLRFQRNESAIVSTYNYTASVCTFSVTHTSGKAADVSTHTEHHHSKSCYVSFLKFERKCFVLSLRQPAFMFVTELTRLVI